MANESLLWTNESLLSRVAHAEADIRELQTDLERAMGLISDVLARSEAARDEHPRGADDMKIGQVGNLILWGTMPIQCPVCHETVPPGETHRHDGPLDVEAEWHDPDTGRIAELWITPEGEAGMA